MSFIDTEIIKKALPNRRVIYLDRTVSTNADVISGVKGGTLDTGDVVIAGEQSGGRGRLGKSFSSPAGGIYMSFCEDNIEHGLSTVICAVALSRSLERLGFSPQIKWVNDIYIEGKKVSGILCQAIGDSRRAVIGIGINLKSDTIPAELSDKAGALDSFIKESFSKEALICSVISEYERLSRENASGKRDDIISYYSSHLCHMGKKITIVSSGEVCTTLGVDNDGQLIVITDEGDKKVLSSGEISITIND